MTYIHLYVDWWVNSDKIKSYIKFCLTKPKHKIYARNCHIEEVDKSVANSFCDNYHLQGHSVHGSINLGLYYKDTLVSVMCFGSLRLKEHKAGEYELHRYCVKDDYLVVGGASKLHKYFIKKYNPKYIRSYSDNDYSSVRKAHTFRCGMDSTWYVKYRFWNEPNTIVNVVSRLFGSKSLNEIN